VTDQEQECWSVEVGGVMQPPVWTEGCEERERRESAGKGRERVSTVLQATHATLRYAAREADVDCAILSPQANWK
jgi:hypothetical protein